MNKFIREISRQISMGLKQQGVTLLNGEFEVDGVMYKIIRTAQIVRVSKRDSINN